MITSKIPSNGKVWYFFLSIKLPSLDLAHMKNLWQIRSKQVDAINLTAIVSIVAQRCNVHLRTWYRLTSREHFTVNKVYFI